MPQEQSQPWTEYQPTESGPWDDYTAPPAMKSSHQQTDLTGSIDNDKLGMALVKLPHAVHVTSSAYQNQ